MQPAEVAQSAVAQQQHAQVAQVGRGEQAVVAEVEGRLQLLFCRPVGEYQQVLGVVVGRGHHQHGGV